MFLINVIICINLRFSVTSQISEGVQFLNPYVRVLTIRFGNYSFVVDTQDYQGKVSPCSRPHEPRRGVEVYLYSFMTSALDRGGWSTSRPGRLYTRERPGTHCTGGWLGPRAGLDRYGKSRPHRDSIPGPSSP